MYDRGIIFQIEEEMLSRLLFFVVYPLLNAFSIYLE